MRARTTDDDDRPRPDLGTELRPRQLEATLRQQMTALTNGAADRVRPIIIPGRPGIGKSEIVRQAADATGLPMIALDLSVRDPVDLGGLPIAHEGEYERAPPRWSRDAQDHDHGVLFLDDLGTAKPAVQAAAFRLVHEGRVGAAELPEGWLPIAATNRREDKTVQHPIPAPLANRFVWLPLAPDVDDWIAWAIDHGIDPRIRAFVRWMGDRVLCTEPRRDGAFASPRTWEFLDDHLAVVDTLEPEVVYGIVGEGAGAEFLEFLEVVDDLPDLDRILAGTSDAFPQSSDARHVVCSALTSRYADAPKEHAARIVDYALTLPAEFSVILVRNCLRATADANGANPIAEAPGYDTWHDRYKDVIL